MTPDEGLRKQIEIYRGMTPKQRLKIGYDLFEIARNFSRAGVRHQNPTWNRDQIEREVAWRFQLARDEIGADIVERVE